MHTRRQRRNLKISRWGGPALTILAMAMVFVASGDAQTYRLLYAFKGGSDGENPRAGVLAYGGKLYGTTFLGGSASGCGAVFQVDVKTRQETVLHSFTGVPDGCFPKAQFTRDSAGQLYGSTSYGGANNFGTVFRMDTSGRMTVLYNFTGGADGSAPFGALMRDSAGDLYGTASGYYGGPQTVFKLDTAGNLTTLHTFSGGLDGSLPAGLGVLENGILYGTTTDGGSPGTGYGTVFQVDTTTGQESVLYTFTGGADGAYPESGLISDGAGNLYGTASCAVGPVTCWGVVYRLNISTGLQTVLYSFKAANDGCWPVGGLVRDAAGNLYGTTSSCGRDGGGTMYKLESSGVLTTLHAFYPKSGGEPMGNLSKDAKGTVYGTTYGLPDYSINGGVFEFKP